MKDFPAFMKNSKNRVPAKAQYTPGIEGYVYDGKDESQIAYWTYTQPAKSEIHTHEYDEYMVVVQGQYIVIIGDDEITLNPGDEYVIEKDTEHGGYAEPGTRVIYAFEKKRIKREL
jgi:quercetin dioxygenase-like cupin family protein